MKRSIDYLVKTAIERANTKSKETLGRSVNTQEEIEFAVELAYLDGLCRGLEYEDGQTVSRGDMIRIYKAELEAMVEDIEL